MTRHDSPFRVALSLLLSQSCIAIHARMFHNNINHLRNLAPCVHFITLHDIIVVVCRRNSNEPRRLAANVCQSPRCGPFSLQLNVKHLSEFDAFKPVVDWELRYAIAWRCVSVQLLIMMIMMIWRKKLK